MFSPGQTVVAAVSGGPDSAALLHCLHTLRETLSISLIAAHLDHGFRGAESAADAEYVRELCLRLDIPCRLAYENVPEQKKRLHLSSQEAAREIRHAFLRTVAEEMGADRIALGHTRDDRAETILLNLFRGTGPDGLGGFPPVRLPLVRPLYDVSRAETAAYCALHGLAPRTDPSNASLDYGRNRVRHEVLPYLVEHYNPQIVSALLRMSDLVSAENEALSGFAEGALLEIQRDRTEDRIVLDAEALSGSHIALQRRMLRLAIARIRGGLRGIENDTIEAILRAAALRERLVVQLPRDGFPPCRISLTSGRIRVIRSSNSAVLAPWHVDLPAEGEIELPCGGGIAIRVFASVEEARAECGRLSLSGAPESLGNSALLFPLSELRLPLAARSWRAGDHMRPRGLNGTKKLQDIFVDRKTPLEHRRKIPVIVESEPPAEMLPGGSPRPAAPGDSARGRGGRILGILGMQGGESSLPLIPGARESEIIGACVLIMALSDTGVT